MAELAPVGQLLVAAGLIDQAALERCLQEQSQSGRDIGSILIDRGLITQDDLARTLAKHYRVPAVDLDKLTIEEKVLGLVPEDVARKHNVLPLRRMGDTLTVAMANPANMSAIDDLRFITGHKVEPVVVPEIAISAAIEGYYGSGGSESLAVDADLEIVEVEPDQEEEDVDLTAAEVVVDAPVVKLVNGILIDAVQKEATHIHLEPDEEGITRVRYRIDGQLREVASVRRMRAALASRIKIISDLNIAERRLPQEGRFNLRVGENTVGFKTSSLPTSHGERFLLEILDQRGTLGDIDDLGFLPDDAEKLKRSLHRSSGLVLITGPRRSGKTTTLYSALNHLKSDELSILTAENPIEWTLKGVNQTQIRGEIGLSYSAALKAMVQQDPDILMVPEIEDPEVAAAVIRTALDGYRLLSSLDAKHAPDALVKLLELGIEPALVGSAVRLVLSQRLVKKLCDSCRVEASPSEREMEEVAGLMESLAEAGGSADLRSRFYLGGGCDRCGGAGYKGRIPVCEVLEVSGSIREVLFEDPSAEKLRGAAVAAGMETLSGNTLRRAAAGETSLEECLRILRDTHQG